MKISLKTKFILYGALGIICAITVGTVLHDSLMELGWAIAPWDFAIALGLFLLLLLIPLWLVLDRWIFSPLSHMETSDQLVARGDLESASIADSDIPKNEIGALMQSRNAMLLALSEQREQLEAEKKQTEVLLQEVYHRVKNNLQIVSSLLYHQAANAKDEEVRAILQESRNRVRSMALVHQELYQSADLASIEADKYLGTLASNLFESYGVDGARITLEMNVDKVQLNLETAIPIGLIINELMSNAFKHAFPNDREGKINVELHRLPENVLSLSVRDDGVGYVSEINLEQPKTLGWNLVQDLCYQLGGKLDRRCSGGTAIEMTFTGMDSGEIV